MEIYSEEDKSSLWKKKPLPPGLYWVYFRIQMKMPRPETHLGLMFLGSRHNQCNCCGHVLKAGGLAAVTCGHGECEDRGRCLVLLASSPSYPQTHAWIPAARCPPRFSFNLSIFSTHNPTQGTAYSLGMKRKRSWQVTLWTGGLWFVHQEHNGLLYAADIEFLSIEEIVKRNVWEARWFTRKWSEPQSPATSNGFTSVQVDPRWIHTCICYGSWACHEIQAGAIRTGAGASGLG